MSPAIDERRAHVVRDFVFEGRIDREVLSDELRRLYDQVAPIMEERGVDPSDPKEWERFVELLPEGIAMVKREHPELFPDG